MELTPRQWWLYRLIKTASEKGMRLSIKDIIGYQTEMWKQKKLTFSNLYQFKESQENHSNCGAIYLDIDEINESEEVDKIICKDNNQFYIGTEEEVIAYYNKLMDRVCHFSHKAKVLKDKVSQDNQCKLFTYSLIPLDESQGRAYHETYLKNQNLLNENSKLKEKVEELQKLIKMYQNESNMYKDRVDYWKEKAKWITK